MPSDSSNLTLRIIQINDVYKLDNFPSFKTLCDQYSDVADETLVVLAGDFLAPSLLSALDKGRGMVDVMGASGITHVCFGNHETDIPKDQIAQRILQSDFVWVNTNMRELDEALDIDTDAHDIVHVCKGEHKKTVALLGLLTEDPSLYRADAFGGATIEPVLESTEAYLKELPKDVDLIVPMTHQRISEDRDFCKKFGDIFPIVIGGHDHEPYDETINGSRVIKTGYDGINTAIIDIKWPIVNGTVTDKPTIDVEMLPTNSFAPHPGVASRVAGHEKILTELEHAKLFRIQDWLEEGKAFDTSGNRLGYSSGSTVLVTVLRMAMRATCGLINAGSIRGNKSYPLDQEWFSWSDLKSEIPYPTVLTAVEIPGRVIEATLAHARRRIKEDPPVASGGYIHHCDAIEFSNETFKISKIRDEPFDPEKKYLTTLPSQFFMGMDNHEPLLEWAKEEGLVIDDENGRPAKMALVEMFSALLWLEMGSFADIDADGDGVLTREEIRVRAGEVFGEEVAELVVESIMNVADLNHTGTITPLDMMVVQFVATDMLDHVATHEELSVMSSVAAEVLGKRVSHFEVKRVVKELKNTLDVSGDGKIERAEAMKVLGEVKRRSLLC